MAENTATPEEEPKEEIVDETPVQETPEDQPSQETPQDAPVEDEPQPDPEPTDEEPDPTPEAKPEIDVEEIKRTTIAETQKAVFEKFAEALGMDKKDEVKAKEEGLVPPWEKRGESRPKSWKEASEYSADLAIWKKEQIDKEIEQTQKEQEKEAKEVNKRWNDYWDTEIGELVEAGHLPEVKNSDDPNDLGKQARIKLFAKMQEIGLARKEKGLPPITSAKLIFYEYRDEFNTEPDGADAPVSFGKKGVSSDSGDDYSYDDIRNKSIDQIKNQG